MGVQCKCFIVVLCKASFYFVNAIPLAQVQHDDLLQMHITWDVKLLFFFLI